VLGNLAVDVSSEGVADPLALLQPDTTTLVVLCVLLALWLWSLVDAWRAG